MQFSARAKIGIGLPPIWYLGFGLWWVWWPSIGMHTPAAFPATQRTPFPLKISHMALYLGLCLGCLLVAALTRKSRPIAERTPLLLAALTISSVGVLVMSLAGLGYVGSAGLTVGSVMMGLASVPLAIGWGELLRAAEVRATAITFGASAPSAAAIYYLLLLVGRSAPLIMVVALASLPWFSYVCLRKSQDATPQFTKCQRCERPSFRMPTPILAGVFIYGLAYGLMLNLAATIAAAAGLQSVTLGQALGVGLVGLLFLIPVFGSRKIDLGFIYQPAPPLVILGFLLLQVLGTSDPFLTGVIAVAGYSYFQLFTLAVFADISHRLPAPARLVYGQGLFVDNLGVAVGMLVQLLLFGSSVSSQEISWIAITVFLLLMATSMLTFGRRQVFSLWGLPSPEDDLVSRCSALADRHGLTPREQEIMLLLAKGHNVEHIQHQLVLSVWTVRAHVRRIYEKLDVHNRQQLIDLTGNDVPKASQRRGSRPQT